MSEGLEALQEMRDEAVSSICRYVPRQAHEEVTRYFDKRKSIIEKELKALKVIKEKQVDVHMFIIYDLENYNRLQKNNYCKLTKTEDDLLKEVLL